MADHSSKVKSTSILLLVAVLWLISAILGLIAVYYLRELTILIYALVGSRDYYIGVLTSQVVTIVGGLLWVIVIIGTGEYHLKHAGERKSWRIFAWTIGIELLIIALAFVLRVF